MKKKIELTEEQAANLEKLIDYVYESEAEHFEEHCLNGGKKENHIYWTALQLQELPWTRWTRPWPPFSKWKQILNLGILFPSTREPDNTSQRKAQAPIREIKGLTIEISPRTP